MTYTDVDSAQDTVEFFLAELKKLREQGYGDDAAMDRLLKRLPRHFYDELSRLSESPQLSLENRNQLKTLSFILTRRALRKWLPDGWVSRAIMAFLLAAGVGGILADNPWVYGCMLLIPLLSPRCMGWVSSRLGRLFGASR